jgi:DNA-binding NtrC family response regulator
MLGILLVEDDKDVRELVAAALRQTGHRVVDVADGAAAIERLGGAVYDVVVCDVRLPKVDGLEVFRAARRVSCSTDVILMTSFATVNDAVAALKEGAHDYLTKPFDMDELHVRVRAIAQRRALERELEEARAELRGAPDKSIVGASPVMTRLLDRLATVAESDAPVLVSGESGTGKELVARRIHRLCARREAPFVAVNCAAFPETLLEAELFGHERGAFTGAVRRREGRFKAAHGGTLLLDEIAEMPISAQAKLLRVLQEGVVEPLGTNDASRVDVRVLSSTHRDLKKRISEGLFREDLYYRLNGVTLNVPPLRERHGDLPLLLSHFLQRALPAGAASPPVSVAAWQALSTYPFPGNVREFAHAVQHAVVLARGGPIDIAHLPEDIAKIGQRADGEPGVQTLAAALKQCERQLLLNALAATQGRRARAAELLGISRKNLWEKLRAHEISDSDLDD